MRAKVNRCSYSDAYLRLLHRVTHCYHEPGTRLNITELADELGMSATPVREALSRLSQEKIVENRQQRGFYMKKIDAVEMTELYALSHMNTGFLLRRLAVRGGLPSIADKLEAIFSGPTPILAARRVNSVHDHLKSEAMAPNAAESLRNLSLRTYFVRLVEYSEPARYATLRDRSAKIAAMARIDARRRCFARLNSLFIARAAWLEDVIERSQELASRVSDEMPARENLAVAV